MNNNNDSRFKKTEFKSIQNEQKINKLNSKFQTSSSTLSSLQNDVTSLESDVFTVTTSVSNLSDRIDAIENNSSSNGVESLFDRFRCNWSLSTVKESINGPFFFTLEPQTKGQITIDFDIFSNFSNNSTVKIYHNNMYSPIKESTIAITSGTIHFSFTTEIMSGHKWNFVYLKISNDTTLSSGAYETSIRNVDIKLLGINAKFLTHSRDFMCKSGGNYICATKTLLDSSQSFYICKEKYAFDFNSFKTLKTSNNRSNNILTPYVAVSTSGTQLASSTKAGIITTMYSSGRVVGALYNQLNVNETTIPTRDANQPGCYALSTYSANNNVIRSYHIGLEILNYGNVAIETPTGQISWPNRVLTIADIEGILRVDYLGTDIPAAGIMIDGDGKAYYYEFTFSPNVIHRVFIGCGTRPKLYALANGKFEAYLTKNNNVEKMIITRTGIGEITIDSTDTLEDIQEYWRGPQSSYFIRRGTTIEYYKTSITPTPDETMETWV